MSQNTTDTSMKSSSNTSETSLSIIQCSGITQAGKPCRIFIRSDGQLFRSDKTTEIPGPSGDFDNADCCRHNPDKVKKSLPIKMAIDKKKTSHFIVGKKKMPKKFMHSKKPAPTLNSLLAGFSGMNVKIPTI